MFETRWIENTLKVKANGSEKEFTEISTDSRTLKKGALFVALAGDQFDGHDFIKMAIQNGATGIICSKSVSTELTCFQVQDTLQAMTKLATSWRLGFKIPVLMVAGSVGKTSTKDCLAHLLRAKYPNLIKTEKSQNGYLGIPLTLLGLRKEHDLAVIEIGIDEIGAMQKHLNTVKPGAGVVTAITEEHLEKLGDIETVTKEELLSLKWISKNKGTVLVNLDDPRIASIYSDLDSPISYSLSDQPGSETHLSGSYDLQKQTLTLNGLGLSELEVNCPLPGVHQARNVLAAIAMARLFEVSAEQIKENLTTVHPTQGRTVIDRNGKYRLLLDYYNSNPASASASLDLLKSLAQSETAWICLGDMLELGEQEEMFHRGLCQKLLEHQFKNILLYGPKMKWLADECSQHSIAAKHFDSHHALGEYLKSKLKTENWILLKGSRGMQMEKVLDYIK